MKSEDFVTLDKFMQYKFERETKNERIELAETQVKKLLRRVRVMEFVSVITSSLLLSAIIYIV